MCCRSSSQWAAGTGSGSGQRAAGSGQRKDSDLSDLTRWRAEFPILSRSVYMISNSLGAMPRGVEASLAEYAHVWATRGVRAWADRWWTLGQEVGAALGGLVHAPAGSISMHENVSTAHGVVLSTLPGAGAKDTIVCTAGDFPSVIYQLRALEALGYRLVVVPAREDFTVDVERVVAAIDARTALVAVSHVLFKSSFILDPPPIVTRAHAVGARVMLDLYQSAGIIPVDLTALDVDFAAGGCLKWLCGGPGNAFLYTRPDHLETLKPRLTGWFSHPEPFSFDIDEFAPLPDARRMANGTPSIPAYYAALPGLKIVAEIGVPAIRAASCALTAALLDAVDVRGFRTIAPRDPDRLAGTVAVDVPDALAVAHTLNARDFVVDYRPGVGIRLSPHFYNTRDEIDAVVNEISSIVAHRDYVETVRHSPVT